MNKSDKHHRSTLQSIAHRAMLERGLLPDFSAAALAEVGVREARGHGTCLGEPRFVELNDEISDDVASRIALAKLHVRYVR